MASPMPPAEKPICTLKPLDTGPPMEPIMGLEDGKPEIVEFCTGAGRAVLASDRLFSDVMLFRRLLVRSLACNRKIKMVHHKLCQLNVTLELEMEMIKNMTPKSKKSQKKC